MECHDCVVLSPSRMVCCVVPKATTANHTTSARHPGPTHHLHHLECMTSRRVRVLYMGQQCQSHQPSKRSKGSSSIDVLSLCWLERGASRCRPLECRRCVDRRSSSQRPLTLLRLLHTSTGGRSGRRKKGRGQVACCWRRMARRSFSSATAASSSSSSRRRTLQLFAAAVALRLAFLAFGEWMVRCLVCAPSTNHPAHPILLSTTRTQTHKPHAGPPAGRQGEVHRRGLPRLHGRRPLPP